MRRMRTLGLRNFVHLLPLTAFLIVLICFFRFNNLGQVINERKGGRKFSLSYQDPSEKQELIQVLRRATMPDRTVILTMVDESHASPGSMLEILLQSFKSGQGTKRFLNHLVIIAMDPQAFEYCKLLHPHCIHPSTFEPYFTIKRQSIITLEHNVLTWRRNNVLIEVLELGYNIIFTDADVLWLKSPLANFNPTYELSISCNFSSGGEREDSLREGGIFFMKANAIALEFLKHWKLSRILYPNPNAEESLCETIKQNVEITEAYGFRVHGVDANHFGGLCQLNKDMLEKVYTIHANCCDGLSSKVHDLRIVLDDWIHFNASEKMALRWPQKCTG